MRTPWASICSNKDDGSGIPFFFSPGTVINRDVIVKEYMKTIVAIDLETTGLLPIGIPS